MHPAIFRWAIDKAVGKQFLGAQTHCRVQCTISLPTHKHVPVQSCALSNVSCVSCVRVCLFGMRKFMHSHETIRTHPIWCTDFSSINICRLNLGNSLFEIRIAEHLIQCRRLIQLLDLLVLGCIGHCGHTYYGRTYVVCRYNQHRGIVRNLMNVFGDCLFHSTKHSAIQKCL